VTVPKPRPPERDDLDAPRPFIPPAQRDIRVPATQPVVTRASWQYYVTWAIMVVGLALAFVVRDDYLVWGIVAAGAVPFAYAYWKVWVFLYAWEGRNALGARLWAAFCAAWPIGFAVLMYVGWYSHPEACRIAMCFFFAALGYRAFGSRAGAWTIGRGTGAGHRWRTEDGPSRGQAV